MLEKKGIALQTNALKDHNAMGIIDNFAKRLKTIVAATAIKTNSVRWIDQVDDILKRYNNSANSAIANKTPNEAAEPGNYQEILDLNVEKDKGNHTTTDLKPGDKVRTNVLKNDANSKGTDPKWSGKVHTVKETMGQTITLESNIRQTARLIKGAAERRRPKGQHHNQNKEGKLRGSQEVKDIKPNLQGEHEAAP